MSTQKMNSTFRKFNENGGVGEPLKIAANANGFSTQHPAVGKDINGKLWLYFSSFWVGNIAFEF